MKYRWDVINFLIKKFNYQTYLEIGIDRGQNFDKIIATNKHSVDPAEGRYASAKPTHKMTSDEFFASNTLIYDFIFIDGLHHSDQVDRDIENSLKCISENGTILLHDANPLTEAMQIVPRQSSSWSGDVWKSIVKYRSKNLDWGCIVLDMVPNDEALAVIKKGINSNFNLELPELLSYNWLDLNRIQALGIVNNTENFLHAL